ncbi:kinase-like domain-containing protein [Paraphysoderma sedebokerense]|nr:kinase-like domain-containing protein [Paraphysoderma sedebokerense]
MDACQNLVVGGKKEELNESELPPLPKVFKESDFQRLELLGSGADGKVWKAIHVATRRTVALKCMVMPPECEYVSDFDRVALGEVRANQVLDHPGILKTYGYYKPAPTEFVLVLEYCDGKTLTALSKKHGPLKSETVRKLFAQVVDAVEHCHLKRVAHRDIKLCNLMVSKKQELKLLDFGISTIVSKRFPVMRDFCGTATYMAPEIYAHRGYTVSAEIWSLGVALFTLLAGNLPFDGSDHEIEAMVQTCESHVNGGCDNTCSRKCKVKFPSHFSDAAKDLIGRMLTIDPAKRITIKEIKQHPWWNETKKERFHFVTRMKYRMKHLKVKRLRNKVAPEVVPAFAPEFLPEPILEIEEQREIPGGAVNKNRQWMLGLDRVFGRKGFKKLGEQKIDSAVNIHNPVNVSDQVSTNKRGGFLSRIVRKVIGVKKNKDCRGENGQEGVAVF